MKFLVLLTALFSAVAGATDHYHCTTSVGKPMKEYQFSLSVPEGPLSFSEIEMEEGLILRAGIGENHGTYTLVAQYYTRSTDSLGEMSYSKVADLQTLGEKNSKLWMMARFGEDSAVICCRPVRKNR